MLSTRCHFAVLVFAALSFSLTAFAQGPGSTPSDDFFVHHKHASITQAEDAKFGSAVAIGGDVLLSADLEENVEILRRQSDGSWSFEAALDAPEAGIEFGSRHAMATNGDWIAIGAKLDNTYGLNSGAVHMYKYNGADWDYRGSLSHMAPHGSIVTDQFGMALAMDGDRMVVGSRAENGVGAAGAVHYFTYNSMLDMWIESGFIASEDTSGNSTSKYGESVDISGDWMIVGEHRNNTNGQFAGAAHIYHFTNQCWHHAETFYGDAEWNWLGYDVAISGTNAVAGAPYADTNGLNESGAAKLYQLVPVSGDESFWAETSDITAPTPVQGDWFGLSIDIDGDLLLVGAPRDDDDVINGGVGYFMFDCSTDNYDCVAEGLACDAMQNDRLGMDVALSNGLAVIGAPLDDNIFGDAGSAYVLGADDIGFACDLTAPAAPMVDLVDENDTGASNDDDLTRHTTPDFDIFLPEDGMMAGAGDALVWTLDGTTESEMVILSQDDIDNGYVTMQFVYPGPVLPDGEYTFCSYLIDIFGNTGDAGCLTVTIDNEDPEPAFENGAEYDTSNTDTYGAYLPGASDPADCEALAAAAGGTWAGIINDAEANMVTPGCYVTGGTPYQASTYEWQALATLLPDTTLYLAADGSASLDLASADNITATDNIAMDTLFAEPITFDCDDAGTLVPVTLTAIDMAGNEGEFDIQVLVLDTIAPVASVQDLTVYLDETGHTSVSAGEADAGSFDVCTDVSFSWSQAPECAGDIPRYPLTSGTYDEETSECDDCTSEVDLGFDFTFYGVEYNSLWISSNGLLSFLSSSSNCCEGELLTDGSYDASIAVIHTDIDPDECDDCGIYYATHGEAPNREFVVSWHYVSNYEDNSYRHDGQAVLYEGTNVIEIFNGGLPTYLPDDCDDPMTTGISNQDGTEGVGPYEQICGPVPPALFVFTPNGDEYEMTSCTADLVFDCADVGENNVTLTVADEFGNTTSEQLTITVLDEVAPTVQAAGPHVVYLNEDGEVEYEDLLDLYVALDACGVDTSYVSHVLTCETAIGMEEQSYLVESGPHMMLFVDYDGYLYSFNALNNQVILLEYTGLDVLGSPDLLIPEGDSILYVGDGYEDFVSLDLETGLVSDEFEANENLGVLFDTDNGLGFEDLQAVETAGGVHYALSHDGDGYNVGSGNPLFTFELLPDNDLNPDSLIQASGSVLGGGSCNQSGWFGTNYFGISYDDYVSQLAGKWTAGDVIHLDGGQTYYLDGVVVNPGNCNQPAVIVYATTDQGSADGNPWTYPSPASVSSPAGSNWSIDMYPFSEVGDGPAISSTLLRMLPKHSPEGDDWDWTALAIDAENEMAYGICDENGMDSGSNEKELWSIDWNAQSFMTGAECAECDPDSVVSFTKPDSATAVVDTITPYLAIARGNRQGYFNAMTQSSWNGSGPEGTYWKMGPTSQEGEYTSWIEAHDWCAECQLEDTMSLWVPQGNLFFDIVTTSWTCCQNGGGFAYTRTLVDAPEYSISILGMEGIEHMGRLSSDADAMIFYDGALYVGYENGNIGRVSFTAEGMEEEVLVEGAASDDIGGAVSGYAPQSSGSMQVTAIDVNGNESTTELNVLVVDTILPTILAQDTTLLLDGNGFASLTIEDLAGDSYDNCGIESLTADVLEFDCDTKGENSVTITAIDNLGNVDSLTVVVTVLDLVLPTAIAQDISVYLDEYGMASIESADVDNGSDHPCGGIASMELSQTDFDCSHVGPNTVTLTVFDGSGISASDDAIVTVIDSIAPSAEAQNLTVELDIDGAGSITAAQVDNGSSDACGIASISISQTDFDCSHLGANTVTLTVTDNNGNMSTATATVTVEDNVVPTALAQDLTVQLDEAGAGSITAAQVNNGSSDACGIADVSLSQTDFDCSHVGANTVTLMVTDNNGNQSTATATITVEDNVAPTASAHDLTLVLDETGGFSITASQVDNSSSDACGIADLSLSQTDFDCSHVGTNSVTLTVTDSNGNQSTATATITVEDNEDPMASAQDLTIQLDAAGAASITAAQVDNGSSDACGIADLSLSQTDFDCSHVGANTVTLTVTDAHGNESTATATITVEDGIDPSISAQDVTLQLDASGEGTVTAAQVDNGSSDACGIASILLEGPGGTFVESLSFSCTNVGGVEVTLLVTDNNGNESETTAMVTIQDNVAPMAAAHDLTLELDATGSGSITASQVDNGSSDACGIASISLSQTDFDCSHVGANMVTLTVTDNNGNESTATATITVEDKIDPTASAQDLTVQLDSNGLGSITVAQVDNGSADACGIADLTLSQTDFDCSHLGANAVTLTVTDENGNQSTASATITVEDNIAPSVSASGVTVYLDETGSGTLSVASTASGVTDNCSVSSLTIAIDGGTPAESVSFDCSHVGDGGTEAEIVVTDGSGNETTATAFILALDTVSPVAMAQNLTVELDIDGAGSITAAQVDNGSSDACGIADLMLSQTDFDCSHVGANTVTLTVTDNNGNQSTATATITVEDNEAPQPEASDLDVYLDDAGMASVTALQVNAGSWDNCAVDSIWLDQYDFDCGDIGLNQIEITVLDVNGNQASALTDITVHDTVSPDAEAQDLTVQLDATGAGSITAEQVDNGSSDACGIASISISQTDFDCSHLGANTVTLTVTDNNGNQSTATATITVEDNVDPTISLEAADMTVECDGSGNQAQLQAWLTDNGGAEASDACGISWSHDFMALSDDCGNTGSALVTFTVQDPSGNSVTTSATFTIEDKTDPSIDVAAANQTVECDGAGNEAQLNAWIDSHGGAAASDICGGVTWSHDFTALSDDCGATGSATVTFTATDDCGNASTTSAIFTIEDTTAPDITNDPEGEVYQRDGGEAQAFADWLADFGGMTSGDDCGGTAQSHDSAGLSDECGSTGSETVTFTATDDCGNETTREATFTVIDDYAPSCPLIDLTDDSDTGLSSSDEITQDDTPTMRVMFTGVGVESAEAGDIVELYIDGDLSQTHTVTQTDVDNGYAEFETGPFADGPVAFSALHIDGCSQSSIFAFLSIIVHNTAPTAVGADMTVMLDEDGAASIEAEDLDDGSDDDFSIIDLTADQTDFDCSHVGDNAVTLTVTDVAGNTATTTVTVTVVDDIAPAVELVPMPGGQDPVEVTFTFTTDAYGAGEASATIYDSEGDVVEDYPLGSFPNSGVTDEAVDLDPGTYTIVLGDDWGDGWSWAPATGEDALVISGGATGSLDFMSGTSASLEFTVEAEGAVPGGIIVELGTDGTVSVAAEDLVMSASDNCGIAGMSLDITSFDCDDLGDNAVAVTVTDVNGNATTVSATVTVEDNLGPIVEVVTGSGTAEPVDVTFTFTTDNYGAGEAFATLYDSDGGVVADYPLGSFPSSAVTEETVSLDPGAYTIVLGDDWGDGWAWFPATGLDALVLSGGVSGSLDFVDGSSASLEFTVEAEAPAGPGGITVELGPDGTVSIEPGDVLVSATDNCGVDGMSLDISDFDCDDLGNNAVVLTVTDVNGNSTSESAYVTVEDNEAPVVNIFDLEDYTLYAGETCVNEVDLFVAGQPWYEATDNCGADVEIVYDVINETGLTGCREFDRRWIIQAVDASGNMDSDTTLQHITVLDDIAPTVFFDNAPEDLTIELGADCTADIPDPAMIPADSVAVTFTYTIDQYAGEAQMTVLDSEGEVIEFIDLVTGGSSTYPYDLYFTNGANSLGGFTLIQTLNLAPGDYSFLLYDDWGDGWVWSSVDGTDALVLSGGASGSWDFIGAGELTDTFTVEGASVLAITASATDNCTAMPELGDITYVDSAPQALCEDAGSYTITRTFMATATDDCGNETLGQHIQTLTFLDVTAPQITDSEGIANGETVSEADADDIFAFIDIPNPINLDAEDACGGDVTIVETETFSGFVPTEEIGNYCGAATPAAFLDGDACNGDAPAAIVLEGAYFGGESFTIVEGGINIVESFYDQTLRIEVEVTNADGTGGFIWNADYNEAYSWAQWNGLGRGYKKDCPNVLPGQSPWTGWDYFVMQTGGMIGTGVYAGSELSLTHQPMNYYYGLQVGQGANNVNAKYGASAWFFWSGQLVVNGASQGFLASSGDIMLDLDCTMPWSAEYGYTVSDACGNTTSFSYTVEGDESNAGGAYVSGEESGHQPYDISVIGDLKDPIRVTGLMPNPTNNVSQLGFVVSSNMRLRVDLYSMDGQLVQELYDGNAMTDVEYLMTIDADGLDAGMYQIRIASSTYMAVKKLLVTQ